MATADAAFTGTPPGPEPKGPAARREPEVNKLFRMVMKHEGSDLHLKVGLPPMMRLRGDIRQMQMDALSEEEYERFVTFVRLKGERYHEAKTHPGEGRAYRTTPGERELEGR